VMSPELANDANFLRRFEREAVVARKLQHPNAVRVEDIDEAEDGRPFIVMEYIEGRSLADVIDQDAPMAVSRVCSIVKQAAAALDAAHALGLVHRDIKPSNIALVSATDPTGARLEQVKVLDFGIAKVVGAGTGEGQPQFTRLTLTGTGMMIGTPAYMSPEQAKGLRGDQIDGRSDLYSLGIVMYEMLTGDLPFKAATTVEQLAAHINTPPRPIREVRPDLEVPARVSEALMRCLEKDPALRPASGQALIQELESAGERSVSPPPKRSEPRPAPAIPAEPSEEGFQAPTPVPSEDADREPAESEPVVVEPEASGDKWMLWIACLIGVLILGALAVGWLWNQPVQ